MREFSSRLGFTVTGEVYGHNATTDPVEAAEAAMSAKTFSHIVVSTLPKRISRWLKLDAVSRLEARSDVPVEHVIGNAPHDLDQARVGFEEWAQTHGIDGD